METTTITGLFENEQNLQPILNTLSTPRLSANTQPTPNLEDQDWKHVFYATFPRWQIW